MFSYKDFQNLAGYTYSVNQFSEVLKDVNNKKFLHTEMQEERLKKYIGGTVYNFKNVNLNVFSIVKITLLNLIMFLLLPQLAIVC